MPRQFRTPSSSNQNVNPHVNNNINNNNNGSAVATVTDHPVGVSSHHHQHQHQTQAIQHQQALLQQQHQTSRLVGTSDSLDTQDCQVSSTTTNLMQELQNIPLVTTLQLQQHDTEFDAEKKTILNHPLYPLLALLLQQCELTLARPDSQPPLDGFNSHLKVYVKRQIEREHHLRHYPEGDSQLGREDEEASVDCTDEDLVVKHNNNNNTGSKSREKHGYGVEAGRNAVHYTGGGGKRSGSARSGCQYTAASAGKPESLDSSACSKWVKSQVGGEKEATKANADQDQAECELDNNWKLRVLVDDVELNELVIRAIQVLRIHLLELHKVNELCKDFCSRYIHSLKTKFQSDPMIHDSQPSSPSDSDIHSPSASGCYDSRFVSMTSSGSLISGPVRSDLHPDDYRRHPLDEELVCPGGAVQSDLSPTCNHPTAGPGGYHAQSTSGLPNGYPRCPCYTPNCQHLVMEPPLSGDGKLDENDDGCCPMLGGHLHLHCRQSQQNNSFLSSYHHAASSAMALHASLDGLCVGGEKQKRGVLPKRATQIMKQWLFQHLVHPYPTEDEKRQIASQTNLTILQVNNWFINARRRILQPMLDASNFVPLGPSGGEATGSRSDLIPERGHGAGESQVLNKKKKASTSRPSNNRFWPASLVAAAAVHPVAAGLISSVPDTSGSISPATYSQDQGVPVTRSRLLTIGPGRPDHKDLPLDRTSLPTSRTGHVRAVAADGLQRGGLRSPKPGQLIDTDGQLDPHHPSFSKIHTPFCREAESWPPLNKCETAGLHDVPTSFSRTTTTDSFLHDPLRCHPGQDRLSEYTVHKNSPDLTIANQNLTRSNFSNTIYNTTNSNSHDGKHLDAVSVNFSHNGNANHFRQQLSKLHDIGYSTPCLVKGSNSSDASLGETKALDETARTSGDHILSPSLHLTTTNRLSDTRSLGEPPPKVTHFHTRLSQSSTSTLSLSSSASHPLLPPPYSFDSETYTNSSLPRSSYQLNRFDMIHPAVMNAFGDPQSEEYPQKGSNSTMGSQAHPYSHYLTYGMTLSGSDNSHRPLASYDLPSNSSNLNPFVHFGQLHNPSFSAAALLSGRSDPMGPFLGGSAAAAATSVALNESWSSLNYTNQPTSSTTPPQRELFALSSWQPSVSGQSFLEDGRRDQTQAAPPAPPTQSTRNYEAKGHNGPVATAKPVIPGGSDVHPLHTLTEVNQHALQQQQQHQTQPQQPQQRFRSLNDPIGSTQCNTKHNLLQS